MAAHGTITVSEGIAYVPFLGLHAFDMATGESKWQSVFRKKVPAYMGTYAQPLVIGSSVYVTDTGTVYAFNKNSGKQLWRAKLKRVGIIPELRMTDSLLLARFGGTFTDRRKTEGLSAFGVAGINPENP